MLVLPTSTRNFAKREAGGKGYNLYLAGRLGFKVPAWVAIGRSDFVRYLHESRIGDALRRVLQEFSSGRLTAEQSSSEIEKLFSLTPSSPRLKASVSEAFMRIGGAGSVAVRSSASDEDGSAHSFAGQLSTYLNIRTADEALSACLKCFASAFSARSLTYRRENKLPVDSIQVAVVIQKMLSPPGFPGSCLPAIPWLLNASFSVFIMAMAMSAFFVAGRRLNFLRSLNRVSRSSHGSEYYPFAIFLTFLLSHQAPYLYLSGLLVLAWADAGAALIGGRYGRHRYLVDQESKSVEGSLVFLLLALLGIALPLLVLSPLPADKAVLCSFLVALIVTGIEAISQDGRDNIFIPLGTILILQKITTKPLAEVLYQNLSLGLLASLIVVASRRSRSFNAGGAIGVLLFTYAAWSLGSEMWALPALGGLILFLLLKNQAPQVTAGNVLRSRRVVRALLVPFLILLTANLRHEYDFYYGPFVIALAAAALVRVQAQNFFIGVAECLLAVVAVPFAIAGPRTLWVPAAATVILVLVNVYLRGFRTAGTPRSLEAALLGTAFYLAAQHFGLPLWRG